MISGTFLSCKKSLNEHALLCLPCVEVVRNLPSCAAACVAFFSGQSSPAALTCLQHKPELLDHFVQSLYISGSDAASADAAKLIAHYATV